MADGAVTLWGLHIGLGELNPFLRYFMRKFGSLGLLTTRAAALGLLVLLYNLLSGQLWIFFGAIFSLVLGFVLSIDLKKLSSAKDERSSS